jgi:endonuclease/exonuclease/phosphatase family metal-dependent hydrolase
MVPSVSMDDIPPRSYGALLETTVRVVTWNVWGLYGPWQEREAAIEATLHVARADVLVLTESWSKNHDSQCTRLADSLGLRYHCFSGVPAQEDEAALSGVAVMSRWPIQRESSYTCGAARVQFAELAGPRGPIQVFGLVMDAWWFDQSEARQRAIQQLLSCIDELQNRAPLVLCGDFNADPDSDEIRMLTGRMAAPVPGLSFYDAWEVAGLTPGHTWSNSNPGRPRSSGPIDASTTSSRRLRASAAQGIRCTPSSSAGLPSITRIHRITTPFERICAIERAMSGAWQTAQ